MATTREFLDVLFPPDTGGSLIEVRHIKPGQVLVDFFKSTEQLLTTLPRNEDCFNVYFGVCPRSRRAGTKDAIRNVHCLWVDLDAKHVSGGKLEALARLRDFPFPPTIIVDSGHGYHSYWALKEPEEIVSPPDIVRIESHLKALVEALGGDRQAAELARLLRLPGTMNVKNPSEPVPVTIESFEPKRKYDLSEFSDLLDVRIPVAVSRPIHRSEASDENQELIPKLLRGCKFIHWASDNQSKVSEPLWYAIASNLAPFENGRDQFHRISQEHPSYSTGEADRKFDHAKKDTRPHSCQFIQEQGFDCSACPWKDKITSPAALAHKDIELPALIESLQPGALKPLQEVIHRVAGIQSPLEREGYLKAIAAKDLGCSVGALREELARQLPKNNQQDESDKADKTQFSAVFPDLVDVVVDNQGRPAYLLIRDKELIVQPDVILEDELFLPPPKDQIPWLLPRSEEIIKHYDEQRSQGEAADLILFEDLRAYHRAISDLPDERYYDLLTAWDLHTYLIDQVLFSPIISFFAVPERGKSRTGKGMIFVAYRGVHVETLRESNLIRLATNWKATLFFDVMDLWKKAERNQSEDVVLHRFEKGVRIARVLYPERGPHRDTVFFEPFGATIIGTNENVHHILETRAVQITMPESTRQFELEVTPEAALPLKERLLAFRARHLHERLPELLKPAGGRLGDILKPLCQIVQLVNPSRMDKMLELIRDIEVERRNDRSEGLEAAILRAIVRSSHEVIGGTLSVKSITEAFNEDLPDRSKISARKVGWRIKALGIDRARMADGSRGIRWNHEQLILLCTKYGVEFTSEMSETSGLPF